MPSTWIMFLNSWLTHDKLLESRASRVRHLKLVDHKTELLKDAIKINPFNVFKFRKTTLSFSGPSHDIELENKFEYMTLDALA